MGARRWRRRRGTRCQRETFATILRGWVGARSCGGSSRPCPHELLETHPVFFKKIEKKKKKKEKLYICRGVQLYVTCAVFDHVLKNVLWVWPISLSARVCVVCGVWCVCVCMHVWAAMQGRGHTYTGHIYTRAHTDTHMHMCIYICIYMWYIYIEIDI